jgi:protein-S-isoprenylcysteine O-methyltransferase Ste14
VAAGDVGVSESDDAANVIIPPPVAWALAFVAGLAVEWLYPLPFVPPAVPRAWVGAGVLAAGFALAIWAVVTMRKAGTRVEPYKPTTAIVANGPYRFSRNPIYIGMVLGQIGLAIGFDSLWILAALAPFYLVIRYGVIAREEAYLERKFGAVYLGYKSRVRRWL